MTLRETQGLFKTAPLSNNIILNYVAEHELGLVEPSKWSVF